MAIKTFPAAVVLSVYDGHMVCQSFSDVHGLMDHLYPGIMTIGCAAMQPKAAAELLRWFPVLGDAPKFFDPWQEWAAAALAVLPGTFDVQGDIKVPPAEIKGAFDAFMTGAR